MSDEGASPGTGLLGAGSASRRLASVPPSRADVENSRRHPCRSTNRLPGRRIRPQVYVRKPRIQVIYIDKDHLHLFVGPNPDTQRQITQDLTKY